MGAGVVGPSHEGEGEGAERRLAVWVAVDPEPVLGAPSVNPAALLIGAGVVLHLTRFVRRSLMLLPDGSPSRGSNRERISGAV